MDKDKKQKAILLHVKLDTLLEVSEDTRKELNKLGKKISSLGKIKTIINMLIWIMGLGIILLWGLNYLNLMNFNLHKFGIASLYVAVIIGSLSIIDFIIYLVVNTYITIFKQMKRFLIEASESIAMLNTALYNSTRGE